MKSEMVWEYILAFDTNGGRADIKQAGQDIHDVLKKVRKTFPDARHFRILRKNKIGGSLQ